MSSSAVHFYRAVSSAVLWLHLPVTFVLALRLRPHAELLLPRAVLNHTNSGGERVHTDEYVLQLALPCIVSSALLLYAGVAAREQIDDGVCTAYDGDEPMMDLQFWSAAAAFVLVRNLLLLEVSDLYCSFF